VAYKEENRTIMVKTDRADLLARMKVIKDLGFGESFFLVGESNHNLFRDYGLSKNKYRGISLRQGVLVVNIDPFEGGKFLWEVKSRRR
jgi:hypothetical protein